MIDAHFTPVLVAAGFNEREHQAIVNDSGAAYDAVRIIMADKAIANSEVLLGEMLETQAREKHAATEPEKGVVAWSDWLLKVIKEIKPYESVVMAVQLLQPAQKAALRERVINKLKVSAQ